jgi:hypothetical protein
MGKFPRYPNDSDNHGGYREDKGGEGINRVAAFAVLVDVKPIEHRGQPQHQRGPTYLGLRELFQELSNRTGVDITTVPHRVIHHLNIPAGFGGVQVSEGLKVVHVAVDRVPIFLAFD